jgi:hypothetical protein
MPGIGSLQKKGSDIYLFKAEKNTLQLLPNIHVGDILLGNDIEGEEPIAQSISTATATAEQLMEPEAEGITEEKKEDYWWVYAIILALLGIGALLYYYI